MPNDVHGSVVPGAAGAGSGGGAFKEVVTPMNEERLRLLRAGAEEMRDRGSIEPRVFDIVKRAGLSNKAFYRHFDSRDDLILAILELGMQVRLAALEQAMSNAGTAVDRVRGWVSTICAQAVDAEVAALVRPLLVYQAWILQRFHDVFVESIARLKRPLRAALEAGEKSGELPECDPQADTEAIFNLALGWMHTQLITCGIPTQAEADNIVDFALRGLLAPRRGR